MRNIKEKRERALGTKLFLKADRCNSAKCATIRRPTKPGMHGERRRRGAPSEYALQLTEKQKLQIIYGLSNTQTTNLFKKEEDKRVILRNLEKRLDRTVFLLGIAKSSRIARQLVSHGHILVNNKKVTISSYVLKVGDTIAVREESRKRKNFEELENQVKQAAPPMWLKTKDKYTGEIVKEPDIDLAGALPFDINLVGEFYARR
ncbi:MAG: 30S ribosomal protein S4 [Nanoarchaeota archaeon]|nr:30S ribosomal protein S4 [Nanoarchaeota archaeon]